jgi:hypothetical protein
LSAFVVSDDEPLGSGPFGVVSPADVVSRRGSEAVASGVSSSDI